MEQPSKSLKAKVEKMNIVTDREQLEILITISIVYKDKPPGEVIEMWLARIAELEGTKHEDTPKSLST